MVKIILILIALITACAYSQTLSDYSSDSFRWRLPLQRGFVKYIKEENIDNAKSLLDTYKFMYAEDTSFIYSANREINRLAIRSGKKIEKRIDDLISTNAVKEAEKVYQENAKILYLSGLAEEVRRKIYSAYAYRFN